MWSTSEQASRYCQKYSLRAFRSFSIANYYFFVHSNTCDQIKFLNFFYHFIFDMKTHLKAIRFLSSVPQMIILHQLELLCDPCSLNIVQSLTIRLIVLVSRLKNTDTVRPGVLHIENLIINLKFFIYFYLKIGNEQIAKQWLSNTYNFTYQPGI